MKVQFCIWLATKTRWTLLTKDIDMPVMPRVGEFMKFKNGEVGDYFAFKITQVTYREGGAAAEARTLRRTLNFAF